MKLRKQKKKKMEIENCENTLLLIYTFMKTHNCENTQLSKYTIVKVRNCENQILLTCKTVPSLKKRMVNKKEKKL